MTGVARDCPVCGGGFTFTYCQVCGLGQSPREVAREEGIDLDDQEEEEEL